MQIVVPLALTWNTMMDAGRVRRRIGLESTLRGWQQAMAKVSDNRRRRRVNRIMLTIVPIALECLILSMAWTTSVEDQRSWLIALAVAAPGCLTMLCVTDYLEAPASQPPGGRNAEVSSGRLVGGEAGA